MSDFNRVRQSRYGQMIYNRNDTYVGKSFELYGEFSEGEVKVFRQIVRSGDVVVDIGANIGAHTLFFARAVGPSGQVVAFEPQRVVFQTLCGNMAINSVTNAHCYHAAVAESAGTVLVPAFDYGQVGNYGGIALGRHERGESVPTLTLDGLDLPRCRLIKVDVEGMEREALGGCAATIARHRPVLYVENDRKEKSDALIRHIDSLGYAMFWHRPPLYNPRNFLNNPENLFGRIVSCNLLCVPKGSGITLQGFQPVAVLG